MRVLAITPIAVLKKDCEFELTPEIEEMIDEMFVNHVKRLQTLLQENKFATDGKEHTFLKEIPNVDCNSIIKVVNSIVNKDIVKDRYIKL